MRSLSNSNLVNHWWSTAKLTPLLPHHQPTRTMVWTSVPARFKPSSLQSWLMLMSRSLWDGMEALRCSRVVKTYSLKSCRKCLICSICIRKQLRKPFLWLLCRGCSKEEPMGSVLVALCSNRHELWRREGSRTKPSLKYRSKMSWGRTHAFLTWTLTTRCFSNRTARTNSRKYMRISKVTIRDCVTKNLTAVSSTTIRKTWASFEPKLLLLRHNTHTDYIWIIKKKTK